MRKTVLLSAIMGLSILSSCSDDDGGNNLIDFTVAFSAATVSTTEGDTSKEIVLTFSRAASEDGTIELEYTGDNAVYGTDFTTTPDGISGTVTIPVASGDLNASFTFNKLSNAIEGTSKSVTFTLAGFSDVDWANGSTASTLVSYTPIAAESGIIDTETGGSNQPNQVYFDFSTGQQTAVQRDSWEIALYNGTENRVFLNSSLLVSAAALTGVTDLLSVTEASPLQSIMELNTLNAMFEPISTIVISVDELLPGLPVGYHQFGDLEAGISFTDSPEGTLEGTAFAEVSTNPEENFVYLVSLGSEIPTDPAPTIGSLNTTGDHRGFLKVRVLTDGNSYTIQYADLNETASFSEITVAKDDTYNLTAVSLTNGKTVEVEPAKDQWDINLSGVFSNYGPQGNLVAGLTYSDYVLHNTLGEVGLYQVTITDGVPSYANFSRADVDESALVYDNRSLIGSGWRTTFGTPAVNSDRYYVVKDADGNFYKFNFTAFTSTEGERGHFQFVYDRL